VVTNAQPNITSVGTLSNLSVTGNVTANTFIGTIANANYSNYAGIVTGYYQPNIHSLGTIWGNLTLEGNVGAGPISITLNGSTGNIDANIVNATLNGVVNALYIVLTPITYANRPASVTGIKTIFSDANTTTFHNIVSGGGANVMPAYYDGTYWRIG
jgi:hypothetical protein